MIQRKTLYDILGVPPSASAEQIASAFRLRQAELEGRGDAARDELVAVRDAHRILVNAERRRKYDATLAVRAPRPPPAVSHGRSRILLGLAVFAFIAGGVFWKMRPDAAPAPQQRPRGVELASPPVPAEQKPEATEEAAKSAEATSPPAATTPAPGPTPTAGDPATAAMPVMETPPAIMAALFGNWQCEDPLQKHTAEYDYGRDGLIMVNWGKRGAIKTPYRMEGMIVRYVSRGEPMTLQIDSISAGKMVKYANVETRLTCDKLK